MEFIISRQEFLKGLQIAQGVIDPRRTLPILGNILIETSGDKKGILLTATDLQIGIQGLYPAVIVKEGKAAVNARKIFDLVKELSDDQIKIVSKESKGQGQKIIISCQKAEFSLPLLPVEDFPSLPQIQDNVNIEQSTCNISAAIFKQLVLKIIFAASTETTQRVLSGVYLGISGEQLEMAALDGHRLTYIKEKVEVAEGTKAEGTKVVVSKRTLTEIIKITEAGTESILRFNFLNNQIFLRCGQIFFFSQLIEGEFPDFRRAIPWENNLKMVINRENLLAALRRVSLLADEKSKAVKFIIKGNQLTLFSQTPELGEGKEELEVNYSGTEEITINFNARYLIEVLNVLADQVVFKIKDDSHGCIITAVDNEDYIAVVMPLRF